METIRINKFLSNNGVCSRRQADQYIDAGRVKINNVVVDKLGTMVNEETDEVKVDGEIVKTQTKQLYIILLIMKLCSPQEFFSFHSSIQMRMMQ